MEAGSGTDTGIKQTEDRDASNNIPVSDSDEAKENRTVADYENTAVTLSSLFSSVKEPLPEKLMAKDITDRAQQLIDNLNAKRKHDTHLIEEYRQALEAHVQKSISTLEQHMFQMYETQRAVIEAKLQELFTCLDRVAVAETELDNFKQSLNMLYEEMQTIE